MLKFYNSYLDDFDIGKGDVLFISSDISKIAYHFMINSLTFNPNMFIDCLIDKIGENGTLVFPTYNWDFCKGITFEYNKTKSKVGALTNIALQRKDFKRTKHPIYSFVAWGKDQDLLCSMGNKSSFGSDSPFAYFYDVNAKNLFIDVDYNHSMTFVHYLEEKNNVKYRFSKNFKAGCIDEFSKFSTRTYSMFVRPIDGTVETMVEPMNEIFVREQIVQEMIINESRLRVLDMKKAYDLVESDIINNNSKNLVQYK